MPIVEFALVLPWLIFMIWSVLSITQLLAIRQGIDLAAKTELLKAVISDYRLRSFQNLKSQDSNLYLQEWEVKLKTNITERFWKAAATIPQSFLSDTDFVSITSRAVLTFSENKRELKMNYQVCIPQSFTIWNNLRESAFTVVSQLDKPEPWLASGERDCAGRYSNQPAKPSWSIKTSTSYILQENGSISLIGLSFLLLILCMAFRSLTVAIENQNLSKANWTGQVCSFNFTQNYARALNHLTALQAWRKRLSTPCPDTFNEEKVDLGFSTLEANLRTFNELGISFTKESCGGGRLILAPNFPKVWARFVDCAGKISHFRLRHPMERSTMATLEPSWTTEVKQ